MIKGSNFYYYYYDGLGSVRAITDSGESIVETYTYDVYGKPTLYDATHTEIPQSQFGNRYYFTGREFDKASGLYYYRARYYNPELGRFMSPDPIGPDDGPNLYTYCGNDPINWADATGLMSGKHRIGPAMYEPTPLQKNLQDLIDKVKDLPPIPEPPKPPMPKPPLTPKEQEAEIQKGIQELLYWMMDESINDIKDRL